MRAIFMGTPDFAVGTLQALLQSEHEVVAVVTQPDKPKGRGKAVQYSPVKAAALEAGVPVLQPKRVREPSVLEELAGYAPDVIVVVAFGQLIPKSILDLPRYGCVNVHASLLPKYRGAAPIQWAVINGEPYSGVTTMRMNEGLDTGDILLVEKMELDAQETAGTLFEKLSTLGAQLLLRTLRELEEGSITPVPQPEQSPTPYAAMLTKQMGEIRWDQSAETIERQIRGLNPWPSAYTHLAGKTLKLWKAAVETESSEKAWQTGASGTVENPEKTGIAGAAGNIAGTEASGGVENTGKVETVGIAEKIVETAESGTAEKAEPGTVLRVDKKGFCVQTGNGVLRILEVQAEGKKRMDAGAFLRGHALQTGEKLE